MNKKKYSIEIDHKNRFILVKYLGEIKVADIGESWDELLKLVEFTAQKYNLFSDYSEAVLAGVGKDVDRICDILYHLKDILKGKKQVLLLDEPTSVALSLLFENEVNIRIGFVSKVFSTEEAAFKWITG